MVRLEGFPQSNRVTVAAVTVVVALLATGCAWITGQVDLGVPGVAADSLSLSGFGGRDALVVRAVGVEADSPGQEDRPLVVVLHGLGDDAEAMARMSAWPAASRDRNLIVVFGEGVEHSWNAGSCCGTAAADDVDDIGYVRRLIDDVSEKYPVDPDRVYLAGYSNGGMMTYRFICENSDMLAGSASVAGTDTDDCEPDRPVSLLQISGTDDEVVPIGGGRSSETGLPELVPAAEAVREVVTVDGCPEPQTSSMPRALVIRWGPCAESTKVGFDTVSGASHTYPEGDGYSATNQMLVFWGLA